MAYRNKTFVSFASEDITSYRLMQAWKANRHIAFDFHDAHDLNVALDTSQPETIRRRLRERLANTKQVVLLVGEKTREVAAARSRFLHYEVETIRRLDLPVVFANLNGYRRVRTDRIPAVLAAQFTLSVSFGPAIIRYALDDYVGRFAAERADKKSPRFYLPNVYENLGL